MELWVRSQDKDKLVLAKGFETQYNNYDGGCQIFAVWQNNYQMIGKYKSKERALEVLDAIQTLIEETYDCLDNKIVLAPVYNMPKE